MSSKKGAGKGPDYAAIAQLQSGAIAQHPSQRGMMSMSKHGAADKTAVSTKTSSQMDAVMRIMTGQGERTVAQKLADTNRPTWEQYKKDNEDKLDIVGQDKKQMEAYRKELDADRDKWLQRGLNHGAKAKNDEDSTDDDSSRRRSSKKHKRRKDRKKHSKKKDRKHRRRKYSESGSDDYSSDSDSDRRYKRKKSNKYKNKSKKEDDDNYRLSSFFTKG